MLSKSITRMVQTKLHQYQLHLVSTVFHYFVQTDMQTDRQTHKQTPAITVLLQTR